MSFSTILLIIVSATGLAVAWLAWRNPILFRMALRNLARRKGYALIVILGLTIGTAMIASALIYQDSQEYYLVKNTYTRMGLVDVMVSRSDDTGIYLPFPYSVYEELAGQIAGDERIYAISPGLVSPYARVKNEQNGIYKNRVSVFGVDFGRDRPFGPFTAPDGQEIYGEDLGPGEAMIIQRLAQMMKAEVGDLLLIYPNSQVKIKQIISTEGKATLFFSANAFVTLETAQDIIGAPGQINWIKVSNTGTVENEAVYSDEVKAALEAALGDEYQVTAVKQDLLENARSRAQFMGLLFLGLSVFTSVAGVLLIVNLMVTLAEERKAEMGVARAVGMKRRHLVLTFLFEGALYALAAALLGLGLGVLITVVTLSISGANIGISSGGIVRPVIRFGSLAIAFSVGLLITMATIAFAAWRISRLNIIAAIRDIPVADQGQGEMALLAAQTGLITLGVLVTLAGVLGNVVPALMAGPCLLVLGIGLVAQKYVSPRLVFTLGAVLALVWLFNPYFLANLGGQTLNYLSRVIVTGLLAVTAGVLLVTFNTTALVQALIGVGGKWARTASILKTALAYPLSKKFRTASTLAMFALVIFLTTVIASILAIQNSAVLNNIDKQEGGYPIAADVNPFVVSADLPAQILTGPDVTAVSLVATARLFVQTNDGERYFAVMRAVDEAFIEENEYTFQWIAPEYANGRQVWRAVRDDPTLVVVDGSVLPEVGVSGPAGEEQEKEQLGGLYQLPGVNLLRAGAGDTLSLIYERDGEVVTERKRIIGVMDTEYMKMRGVFTTRGYMEKALGRAPISLCLVRVREGADVAEIAAQLEEKYAEYGFLPGIVRDTVTGGMMGSNTMEMMVTAFLDLGLLVGVAGLGVTAQRAVVQRRQEIGVMRSIGFTRRAILLSFLVETSFVALLGIAIGLGLGILLARFQIYPQFEGLGASFVIPWGTLLVVVGIAYLATLLCTAWPAVKAARIPPSEALRYVG